MGLCTVRIIETHSLMDLVESRFHILTYCCCNICQLATHLGSIATLKNDLAMILLMSLTMRVNIHFKVYSYAGTLACNQRENK